MDKNIIKYIPSFNLKNIPIDKYDKNFTFIVNSKKYQTNRLYADILSPTVCQFHYSDESINEIIININDKNKTETDNFNDFLNFYKYDEISIDEACEKQYDEYFLKLGNFQEYFKLHPELFEQFTVDNILNRLENIKRISEQNSNLISFIEQYNNIDSILNFISEHFNEIDQKEIKNLNYEEFEQIFQNENLKLTDEDTLLEFILNKYKGDPIYSNLFEYVCFKNVSEKTLSKFIAEFDFSDLNSGAWKSICNRLLPHKDDKDNENKNRYTSKQSNFLEFKHEKGNEFHGILRYLVDKTGGNIHDNGTIKITSNSYQTNHYPKNLVDYDDISYFASRNVKDIFILFDFIDKKVQLSNYSILSESRGRNLCHLRNWVLEVSNDNDQWEIIDEHTNDPTLNNSNVTATFDTKILNSFYRYVRLRQTGFSWHCGNKFYFFWIPNIEFYGRIEMNST